jgi:hypothetical protein
MLVDFAKLAHLAIQVVFLFTIGIVSDNGINEGISWPSIEVVASIDASLMIRG